jgi:chemotaxis protein histidine kinase CheA
MSRPLSQLLRQVSCSEAVALHAAQHLLEMLPDWNSKGVELLRGCAATSLSHIAHLLQRSLRQMQHDLSQQQQQVVDLHMQLAVALMSFVADKFPDISSTATDFCAQACNFSSFACVTYLALQERKQGRAKAIALPHATAQALQKHTMSFLPQLLQQIRQQLDACPSDSAGASHTGIGDLSATASFSLDSGILAFEMAEGFSFASLTQQQQQQQQPQQQPQQQQQQQAPASSAAAAAAAATKGAAQLCSVLQDVVRTAVALQRKIGQADSSLQWLSQQVDSVVGSLCHGLLYVSTSLGLFPLVQAFAAVGDLGSPAALQLCGLLISVLKADASSDQPWCQELGLAEGCHTSVSSACVLITVRHMLAAAMAAAQLHAVQGRAAAASDAISAGMHSAAAAAVGRGIEEATAHNTCRDGLPGSSGFGDTCGSTAAAATAAAATVTAAEAGCSSGLAASSGSSQVVGIEAELPWLVLLVRCCLHGCGAGLCVTPESAAAPGSITKLVGPGGCLVEALGWLESSSNAQQLAELGCDVQLLRQTLEALKTAAEEVWAPVPDAHQQWSAPDAVKVHASSVDTSTSGDGGEMQIARHLEEKLLAALTAAGQQLALLAISHACNNPMCRNVSGPSEAVLVGGRSCVCGGCRTAHYCSRQCQREHWQQHKPVCRELAAAGTAAAVPA